MSIQRPPQSETLESSPNSTLNLALALTSERQPPIRLGWRIALTVLLLICLALLTLVFSPYANAKAASLSDIDSVAVAPFSSNAHRNNAPTWYAPQAGVDSLQSSGAPLVLAFYYTWFDENTWTYDSLSDLPTVQYASRDRATMARHIAEAQRAGIDAFLVAWYGPSQNQTETNLIALLDEAAARNFKIGILFETDSPFMSGIGGVTEALRHAIGVHAAHPAYLRADGRPVIFFWRPTIYGVDQWRGVRAQVDAGYGTLWVSEGVNSGYLALFDGHYLYSNTWNPPADLNGINQKFASQVQHAQQQFGGSKLWIATVMPGYNDVRIRPGAGFARDRAGGAYYEQSWQAAMASQPQWIVITSYNEWPEGSYIEPSVAYGDQFLNLTAVWSRQFKAGRGAQVQAAAAPQAVSAASELPPRLSGVAPHAAASGPVAHVDVSLLNLRRGPGTEHTILALIPQGATLPIISSQAEWIQVTIDGQQGWVYGPMVRTANLSDVSPTSGDNIAVESIPPVTASSATASSVAVPTSQAVVSGQPAIGASAATVKANLLNLRSGPDVNTTVLAILGNGAIVTIIGADPARPDWWQVSVNGQQGWVYAPHVQTTVTAGQVPAVTYQ